MHVSAQRSAAGRCTIVSSLGTTEGGHLVGARLSDGLCRSILLAGVEGACETSKSGGLCEDGKVDEHPNSSTWRRHAVPRYAGLHRIPL